MVGPSLSFQALSMKSPSSCFSSISSMKMKALIQTLIYTQASRLIRAFSKAKSIVIQIYKQNNPIQYLISISKTAEKKYKHNKLFFGSFRLHYNWCSSHVTPVPAPVLEGCTTTHIYYDSTWNSAISTRDQQKDDGLESELSGYLQWLEENKVNGEANKAETEVDDIDRLAEMFIASCHEKFMLEKQESYRRFQEMMARSM
ncbi:uncharacterized protein LOC108456364 [Gossypium arboreum]|uniref:DUF761 domain-containing protein n=1 Tax=Gossypium arboreum TaxID=29729 RepID=A0ABR0NRM5_GOSAR|nr:uncharacterized protein LOC108456364 [Gossypium arboreum]KAK5803925.1 hypothetical protein PVK06_031574 [Gossypium arboreum]